MANPKETSDRYNEAVRALYEYNLVHGFQAWQPDKDLTKINSRCIRLYGSAKQYAKYDSRLKVIVEYSAPGAPTLRDYVSRAGDDVGAYISGRPTIVKPGGRIEKG